MHYVGDKVEFKVLRRELKLLIPDEGPLLQT